MRSDGKNQIDIVSNMEPSVRAEWFKTILFNHVETLTGGNHTLIRAVSIWFCGFINKGGFSNFTLSVIPVSSFNITTSTKPVDYSNFVSGNIHVIEFLKNAGLLSPKITDNQQIYEAIVQGGLLSVAQLKINKEVNSGNYMLEAYFQESHLYDDLCNPTDFPANLCFVMCLTLAWHNFIANNNETKIIFELSLQRAVQDMVILASLFQGAYLHSQLNSSKKEVELSQKDSFLINEFLSSQDLLQSQITLLLK